MLRNYLNNILYVLLPVLLVSDFACQDQQISSVDSGIFNKDPLVLVTSNRRDVYGDEVARQVTQALDYSKLPYRTLDFGLISEGLNIPSSVRVIVNTSFLLNELAQSEKDKLLEFVARGGQLVFAGTMAYDEFEYFQGFLPDAGYTIDKNVTGFRLEENVFPGSRCVGYRAPLSDPHAAFKRENFREDVNIYVTANSDTTYPVIIGNRIGLGEVLTINSYSLDEKDYRGILYSTLIKGMKGVPYSVANVGTIFLDDFPAPLYNQRIEPIATEYDMEQAEFVANVWWPDIKALADSFLIDYTAMTAFNYNANVVPPFDFREWQAGKLTTDNGVEDVSIMLARDVMRSRHELAFHGYNHFSLWLEDWENFNFMIAALQSSRKRWRIDDLGPLPVTYVPPTNFIDSLGLQALTRGMPSLQTMSSLYLGLLEDGGNREFGTDPYNDRLFDYPRISSGFTMQDNDIFHQHGMQLLTGIWNHFIHPDDVFQITQRSEDLFQSRNPLGLGWRSNAEYDFGLYDVFKERLEYTRQQYPFLRLVTAREGAGVARDWLTKVARYRLDGDSYTIETAYPNEYVPAEKLSEENHWFMYVPEEEAPAMMKLLDTNADGYAYSRIWEGYLFQLYSSNDLLRVPNLDPKLKYSEEELQLITAEVLTEYRNYQDSFFEDIVDTDVPDTRYEDALADYRINPDSYEVQQRLIDLAIEFGEVPLAIDILEKRILSDADWTNTDRDQLIIFYGWESIPEEAEMFLEELWSKYRNQRVIEFKNQALEQLPLYSPDFVQRWFEREVALNPNDEALNLSYLRSIESQENWNRIKPDLLDIIKANPESDSLYYYTLQRSFYYDSVRTTIELLETFPESSHEQLQPLASNMALAYGYEVIDYHKALYWSNRATDVNELTKLEWIAQLKEYDQFYSRTRELLAEDGYGDSLRVFAGTTLYYSGYRDRAYEIIYPLFESDPDGDTRAHVLINEELKYLSVEERSALYQRYPLFFNGREEERLLSDYRWNRGVKGSTFGEYYSDNFDNSRGRGGISAQFGYRRDKTYTIKTEDIYTSSTVNTVTRSSNFAGLYVEYEDRSSDYLWNFTAGGGLFTGSDGLITELKSTLSYSKDSTYTSAQLSLQPVLTQSGLVNDYYRTQLDLYREDFWLGDLFATSVAAVGKYYSNQVFNYEAIGRLYLQPNNEALRLRGIAELAWADATESYTSGIPYYTPDNFFVQAIGLDLRYREPNTYEYFTLGELEVMAKHEQTDGFFITGRATLEKKLDSFWEFKVGTELSTSQIYRSNRVFFTLSHYFNRSID